ncbi:MAG: AraC family ligand binding domain-containing protein, partial [Bacteroidota bacterium]
MPENIRAYHLHKNDYSNLQFELKDMHPYVDKYHEHTYRAHQHSFYQIIKFDGSGRHFVDFEAYDFEEASFFFLEPGQVHYFCREAANEGTLIHFNDIFLVQEEDDGQHFLSYYLFNRLGKPFFPVSKAQHNRLDR